jgi:hypothetical protein
MRTNDRTLIAPADVQASLRELRSDPNLFSDIDIASASAPPTGTAARATARQMISSQSLFDAYVRALQFRVDFTCRSRLG